MMLVALRLGFIENEKDLKKRIEEHKTAAKKGNKRNEVAVHVKTTKHQINWEGARVISNETQYWRRRLAEAISIQTRPQKMNLDCGLQLNDTWYSILGIPSSNPYFDLFSYIHFVCIGCFSIFLYFRIHISSIYQYGGL